MAEVELLPHRREEMVVAFATARVAWAKVRDAMFISDRPV